MRKKPLRINEEILDDLRKALGHAHALLPKDAQKRYPSLAVYRPSIGDCACDEGAKRAVESYVASWIIGPLQRAVERIERARVVSVVIAITEPDCSCSSSHDPPDGAIHGGSVLVYDDADEGPDAWPDGDWCDDLRALDEAKAHAKQRAAHYRARGYEVRTVEVRR